jgi:hypothetical protein
MADFRDLRNVKIRMCEIVGLDDISVDDCSIVTAARAAIGNVTRPKPLGKRATS